MIIIILLVSFPTIISPYIKTYTAKRGSQFKEIETVGVILREEQTYNITNGNYKVLKQNGEKVSKGSLIANYIGSIAGYESELEKFENIYNEYNKYREKDKKTKEEVDSFLRKLEELVSVEETSIINSVESDIYNKDNVNANFFEKKIEELEAIEVEKAKKSTGSDYYSEISGMISNKIDNEEAQYNIKVSDINSIDLKDMSQKLAKGLETMKERETFSGLRVINNFKWYIFTEISLEQSKDIEEGGEIDIRISEDEEIVKATVKKLEDSNEKKLILLELRKNTDKYSNERYIEMDLIKERYDGLRVPTKGILKKYNTEGVYIKDISGVVKYIPVKILSKGKMYSIVEESAEEMEIVKDGKKQTVKALQMFDEVFKNNNLIREDQIIKR